MRPPIDARGRRDELLGLLAGALLSYATACVAALIGRLANCVLVWSVVSAVILAALLVPIIAAAKRLGIEAAWERIAVNLMRVVLDRSTAPQPNPAPAADTVRRSDSHTSQNT